MWIHGGCLNPPGSGGELTQTEDVRRGETVLVRPHVSWEGDGRAAGQPSRRSRPGDQTGSAGGPAVHHAAVWTRPALHRPGSGVLLC